MADEPMPANAHGRPSAIHGLSDGMHRLALLVLPLGAFALSYARLASFIELTLNGDLSTEAHALFWGAWGSAMALLIIAGRIDLNLLQRSLLIVGAIVILLLVGV